MSDSIAAQARRIEAYCEELNRMAFSLPAPNSLTPNLASMAIVIRSAAEAISAECFHEGRQWTAGEVARITGGEPRGHDITGGVAG